MLLVSVVVRDAHSDDAHEVSLQFHVSGDHLPFRGVALYSKMVHNAVNGMSRINVSEEHNISSILRHVVRLHRSTQRWVAVQENDTPHVRVHYVSGSVRAGFVKAGAITSSIPVVTWCDTLADATVEIYVVGANTRGLGNHFLEHDGRTTHLTAKLLRATLQRSHISLEGMHARKRMKNEHIETMRNLVPGQIHTDTRMCVHPLGCLWTTTNTVDGEKVTLHSFFVN